MRKLLERAALATALTLGISGLAVAALPDELRPKPFVRTERMGPEDRMDLLARLEQLALDYSAALNAVTSADFRNLSKPPDHPDRHFKFPHLWPVKLSQAGRLDYESRDGFLAMCDAASLSR
jgi:hypothetical protein